MQIRRPDRLKRRRENIKKKAETALEVRGIFLGKEKVLKKILQAAKIQKGKLRLVPPQKQRNRETWDIEEKE